MKRVQNGFHHVGENLAGLSNALRAAILIDAKDDRVAAWYASHGAMPLLDAPLSLVLPLELLRKALEAAGKLP